MTVTACSQTRVLKKREVPVRLGLVSKLHAYECVQFFFLFTFSFHILCTSNAVAVQLLQVHVKSLCHKSQLKPPPHLPPLATTATFTVTQDARAGPARSQRQQCSFGRQTGDSKGAHTVSWRGSSPRSQPLFLALRDDDQGHGSSSVYNGSQ